MGLSVGRQWVLCAGVCWWEPTSNATGGVREQHWAQWEAELWCSYRSLSWSHKEFWMNLHRVIPDWGRRIWPVYLCIDHSLDIGWEGQEPPFGSGQFLEREVAVRHQQSEGKKRKHLSSGGWFGWHTTVSAMPGSYCTSATLGLWLSYKKNQTKMNNRISQPN